MTDGIAAALHDLEQAFARYPRRLVLERCPHCGPPVRVGDADLFWLSLKLGNTIGTADDAKALLPLLFERLVTTEELDPDIILGKLANLNWRSWSPAEQNAVDTFLDQTWRVLLSEFPPRTGAFHDAASFLRSLTAATLSPTRFLAIWDETTGQSADRHLATFIEGAQFSTRLDPAIRKWITRESLQTRLFHAFERESSDPTWSAAFANAYDLVAASSSV